MSSKEFMLTLMLILVLFIPGVYAVSVGVSGGEGGSSFSDTMKIAAPDNGEVFCSYTVDGAKVAQSGKGTGDLQKTYSATSHNGESVTITAEVLNAEHWKYSSPRIKETGTSAELSGFKLTAMDADHIECLAEATNRNSDHAKASIEVDSGSLIGYASSAIATNSQVAVTLDGKANGILTSELMANGEIKSRDSKGGIVDCDLYEKAWTTNGAGFLEGTATFDVDKAWDGKIQSAVDAARDGDKIKVAKGTYTENVMIDKSLEIKGAGGGNTIVDGGGIGSVFTIGYYDPCVDVSLTGMTIQNGYATYGGGIYNSGTLTLSRCSISGNKATNGGGICNKGTVNVNSASTIFQNTATHGGGIDNWGTVNLNSGSIEYNTASDGGGINNHASTVNLNGGAIFNNTAGDGGGIYNYGPGVITMNSGSIFNNTAGDGGGIDNNYGTVNIYGGSIYNNTVKLGSGGGITSLFGTVNMYGGSIFNNTAGDGGGIYMAYGTVNIYGGSISNNSAVDGGGIDDNYGTVNLNGGSIDHNTAKQGGGITNNHGTVNLNSGSIDHNKATVDGGGIWNSGSLTGDLLLVHENTLADGTPDDISP